MTSGGNMRVLHLKTRKLTGTSQIWVFCSSICSEEADQNQKLNQNTFNLFLLELESAEQQLLFWFSITEAWQKQNTVLVTDFLNTVEAEHSAIDLCSFREHFDITALRETTGQGSTLYFSNIFHPRVPQSLQPQEDPEPLKNTSSHQEAHGQQLLMARFISCFFC